MLKTIVKNIFHQAGLKIERRDPLEETIPGAYNRSPFLPRVSRGNLYRILYFHEQMQKIRHLDGDIVECGVSVGHGTLVFLLLSQYLDRERTYVGFDSFEGFPESAMQDGITPITEGFYASPPETVLRVLRDGRVPEQVIKNQVRLVKGYFDKTLPNYEGRIALLHLDGDLYESYKISLENLYDKVVPGGIILFDEYRDERWPGATQAIDEFFANKPERVEPHAQCSWKYYVTKQ